MAGVNFDTVGSAYVPSLNLVNGNDKLIENMMHTNAMIDSIFKDKRSLDEKNDATLKERNTAEIEMGLLSGEIKPEDLGGMADTYMDSNRISGVVDKMATQSYNASVLADNQQARRDRVAAAKVLSDINEAKRIAQIPVTAAAIKASEAQSKASGAATDESIYALKKEKDATALGVFHEDLQAGLDRMDFKDLKKLSNMTPEELKKNYSKYFPGLAKLPDGSTSKVQRMVNKTFKFQKGRVAETNRAFAQDLKDNKAGAVDTIVKYAKDNTVTKATAEAARKEAMLRLSGKNSGITGFLDTVGLAGANMYAGIREGFTDETTDAVNDAEATVQYNKEFLEAVGPSHPSYKKLFIETAALEKKLRIMRAGSNLEEVNRIKSEKVIREFDKAINKVK